MLILAFLLSIQTTFAKPNCQDLTGKFSYKGQIGNDSETFIFKQKNCRKVTIENFIEPSVTYRVDGKEHYDEYKKVPGSNSIVFSKYTATWLANGGLSLEFKEGQIGPDAYEDTTLYTFNRTLPDVLHITAKETSSSSSDFEFDEKDFKLEP